MSRDIDFERAGKRFDGENLRIVIVTSRFHAVVTSLLETGAVTALRENGVNDSHIEKVEVPGSLELSLAAQVLASSGRWDAVVCLGAVIKGETAHFEHVSAQAVEGIAEVSRQTGVPVLCGVLTTYNLEQALERAKGPEDNKGYESAMGAIEMALLLRQIRSFS